MQGAVLGHLVLFRRCTVHVGTLEDSQSVATGTVPFVT